MYFRGFDGLRAISIFLVILGHSGLTDHWFEEQSPFHLLISGTSGVRIFFVLSGFLITTLLIEEKEKRGSVSLRNFFIRRFLRLMPPFLLFMFVTALLMAAGIIPAQWQGLGFSVAYLYNFIPRKFYTGELAHTWSLAVEEHFYLLWAPLMKKINSGNLFMLLLLLIGCGSVARFQLLSDYPLTQAWFPDRWTFVAIVPILTGCLFALMYREGWLKAGIFSSPITLLLWIALFCGAAFLPDSIVNLFCEPIQAAAVSLILVGLLHNPDSGIVKVLEVFPLRYAGKISYGLYLWQGLFFRTGPADAGWFQLLPANLLFTVGLAVISYELMEKRILKLKNRFR